MKTTETRGTVSSTELYLRLVIGGNRLALKMLHAREIVLLFSIFMTYCHEVPVGFM